MLVLSQGKKAKQVHESLIHGQAREASGIRHSRRARASRGENPIGLQGREKARTWPRRVAKPQQAAPSIERMWIRRDCMRCRGQRLMRHGAIGGTAWLRFAPLAGAQGEARGLSAWLELSRVGDRIAAP